MRLPIYNHCDLRKRWYYPVQPKTVSQAINCVLCIFYAFLSQKDSPIMWAVVITYVVEVTESTVEQQSWDLNPACWS